MKYPKLGSVSHGTLRPEDLIPCFLDTLEALVYETILDPATLLPGNRAALRDVAETLKGIGRIESRSEYDSYYEEDIEGTSSDIEWLDNRLNEFAPPYCYFGSHPGDGSDFGFWLCDDWRERTEEDGVPVVEGWENHPANHKGLVFVVSDHGNVTLYDFDGKGDAKEVFAIV